MRRQAAALLRAWLIDDFFGAARRRGDGAGSSLTTTIFGQSFLAFVVAFLLVDDRIGATAYAAANLSLSTVLVGLGATNGAQREQRRRADRTLIRTAPLHRRTAALARAAHGSLQLTLVTIGVALPPAILVQATPGVGPAATPLYLLVAIACAALLAGVIDLLVRGAAALGGPLRAALVAGSLRALLLAGAFAGFATCAGALDESAAALPGGRATALAWPPYWAARVVALDGAAAFALALLGALVALALLAGLLPDEDDSSTGGARTGRDGPTLRLAARLSGDGPLRGVTIYTATMLFRSAAFRARVLPLLGLPLAMAALALEAAAPRDAAILLGIVLQFPAIYTPFLIAFLPFVEGGSAGMVLRTSPGGDDLAMARVGATIALVTRLHLPVLLLAGAAAIAAGMPVAAAVASVGLALGLATGATALATRRLEEPPFSCEREAAPAIDTGQLMSGAVVLAGVGGAFATVADRPWAVALGLGAALLAWLELRRAAAPFRARFPAAPSGGGAS